MILDQLKIFLKIVEIGSETKAADLLSVSQSPASALIASFEIIYQVELFRLV